MSEFQDRCLAVIKRSLNGMNSSWAIAMVVFGERWYANSRGRAGMITSVQKACDKMVDDGRLVCRLPPKDMYDHPTYCSLRFGPKENNNV